jgi:FkbM family methyltransferase
MGDTVFVWGTDDPPSCRVLWKLLKQGWIVFDVGAHHGFYTLLASAKVGQKELVIAFEPSPHELQRLLRHLRLNRCSNVYVESIALADFIGIAEFYVGLGSHNALNSLQNPPKGIPYRRIVVPVTTLDRYISQRMINNVDLIKIDVEGAELLVLKGAKNLLQKLPRPIIVCEFIDDWMERFGYKGKEFYEFLREHKYQCFRATNEEKLQAIMQIEEVKERLTNSQIVNIFAVPEERLENITYLIS